MNEKKEEIDNRGKMNEKKEEIDNRGKMNEKKEETNNEESKMNENNEEVEEIEKTEEELVVKMEKKGGEERLPLWKPKTRLGRLVKEEKVKEVDEILLKNVKILEPEIVDFLVKDLKNDLIAIGQSKGKFGGGKRRAWRQTQKKSEEGNVPTFACMAVVGDCNGHVGVGYGKSKETLPSREKAVRNAKLNIAAIKRGCGSFDCACSEQHSIPSKTEGKCGSSRMVLIPAPKGTGLVIEQECKKILEFAGIKDVYSKTFGQTRTKINLAKACFEALKRLEKRR